MKYRGVWFALCVLVLSLIVVGILSPASTSGDNGEETATPTPTRTATPCPLATREPLWVEPVVMHTDQLTQTVVVYIGNGEAVTVIAESGVFGERGDFDAYANPASVEIALWPFVTHHLTVYGKVKTIVQGECVYGGYTLGTTRDRYGAPLVIRQQGGTGTILYLPVVFK